MVAELSSISATTAKQKTSSATPSEIVGEQVSDLDKSKKRRPRWIQASTREPIYSVLDGDDERSGPRCKDNAVIITAVYKSPADNQRKLPSGERASPAGNFDPGTTIYVIN